LLEHATRFRLDPAVLEARLVGGAYDVVVLVNPNNPTGQHVAREALEAVLRRTPSQTRVWVDEAYIDYVGAHESLEQFACGTRNVVVCKSMSKGYALSGLRVAYLCGGTSLLDDLRARTPPWIVSLPAQVAAVRALQEPEYYEQCYVRTHALRGRLAEELARLHPQLDIIPGTANYLLCQLSANGPDALTVASRCQAQGLFLRELSGAGRALGRHAIRMAVKEEQVQQRMVAILARELGD
jgi:histidinol-phosphate/aromatic aminotransferase/cobyric acid decarboxylase-like protein